jgi:hypothetical protein
MGKTARDRDAVRSEARSAQCRSANDRTARNEKNSATRTFFCFTQYDEVAAPTARSTAGTEFWKGSADKHEKRHTSPVMRRKTGTRRASSTSKGSEHFHFCQNVLEPPMLWMESEEVSRVWR